MRPSISIPSSIITARRRSAAGGPSAATARSGCARRTRATPPLFDVDRLPSRPLRPDRLLRAPVLPGRDAGEHPLQHHPPSGSRSAKCSIASPTATPTRHRPCGPAGGGPPPAGRRASPPRPHGHDGPRLRSGLCLPFGPTISSTSASSSSRNTPSPTLDASANNPSLAAPTSSPSASCTRSGSTISSFGRLSDRYVALHGGSSFDLGRSPVTLPPGADGPGGTAVTSNFYEPRDNPHERGAACSESGFSKLGALSGLSAAPECCRCHRRPCSPCLRRWAVARAWRRPDPPMGMADRRVYRGG